MPTIISHRAEGRPDSAPLTQECVEMHARFRRLGELQRPGKTHSREDYQAVIDFYEDHMEHAELTPFYDAVVAARNAL